MEPRRHDVREGPAPEELRPRAGAGIEGRAGNLRNLAPVQVRGVHEAAVGAAPAAPAAPEPVFGARSAKGSNAYANGANQNCGNVLTDRPTTRLHAPPGGASSITFG